MTRGCFRSSPEKVRSGISGLEDAEQVLVFCVVATGLLFAGLKGRGVCLVHDRGEGGDMQTMLRRF
jgi:hypothetical protein